MCLEVPRWIYGRRISADGNSSKEKGYGKAHTELKLGGISMKIAKKVLLIVALFVLLIVGASSIVITRENEYSLIRQFGKIDHEIGRAHV